MEDKFDIKTVDTTNDPRAMLQLRFRWVSEGLRNFADGIEYYAGELAKEHERRET